MTATTFCSIIRKKEVIKIDEKKKFGERLSELRKKKKVSQSEVADYIELTVAAYQNYETGRREAGYEIISKLADFYGVTTDYLLGRPEATAPKSAIDSLVEEHSLHAIEESLLRMYFKLEPKKRAEFMQSVLDDVQKNMLAEAAEPQEKGSDSISVSTTLGEMEDQMKAEAEAHAKDAG